METMLSPIIDLNQWADLEADLIGYLHVFEETKMSIYTQFQFTQKTIYTLKLSNSSWMFSRV